jgi:hypothetical protein
MFRPKIVVFNYNSLVDEKGQIINPGHVIPFLQELLAQNGILAITADGLTTRDEIITNLAAQGVNNIPPEWILTNPAIFARWRQHGQLRIEHNETWVQVNVAAGAPERSDMFRSTHLHVIQMLLQLGYYPDVQCPITLPDGTIISSIEHGGNLVPYDVRDIRIFDYSRQACQIAQAVGISAIHTNTTMLLAKVKGHFRHLKSALEQDKIEDARRIFSDIQRNAPKSLDRFVQRLLWQYMDRIEIVNGENRQIKKGIAKGGILSPLLGAIYLEEFDKAMERSNVHYVRYMDDWVILTKTRSELRKLVKLTHKIMNDLKLALHPDKTFIGRVRKGFDFLGYHFTQKGLWLSLLTIQRFQAKLTRLYEQGADQICIEVYRKYWRCWVRSGI